MGTHDHLPNVHTQTEPGSIMAIQHVLFRTNERATYPEASELFVAIVFFAMWVVLRKLAFDHVLMRLTERMGAPDDLSKYKCSVLIWNGVVHTWSTLWLLSWLPSHRWYWDTEWLWENFHVIERPQKFEIEMKCFYMLQLGYHMQSIVWHFLEKKRPDFLTMAAHHFVTVILIVCSYLTSYLRIGLLVLLVHDASDVFVCMVKVFQMCGWKKASHSLFVVMVLCWAYTRLYLFPVWVIGSTFKYPEKYRYDLNWWFFVLLMSTLLVLHIWWFYLFLKIAAGIAKHGSGEDITETKGADKARERDLKAKAAKEEQKQSGDPENPVI